jgi:hypothetical protein
VNDGEVWLVDDETVRLDPANSTDQAIEACEKADVYFVITPISCTVTREDGAQISAYLHEDRRYAARLTIALLRALGVEIAAAWEAEIDTTESLRRQLAEAERERDALQEAWCGVVQELIDAGQMHSANIVERALAANEPEDMNPND